MAADSCKDFIVLMLAFSLYDFWLKEISIYLTPSKANIAFFSIAEST